MAEVSSISGRVLAQRFWIYHRTGIEPAVQPSEHAVRAVGGHALVCRIDEGRHVRAEHHVVARKHLLPEKMAEYYDRIYRALSEAITWAEFRTLMPRDEYAGLTKEIFDEDVFATIPALEGQSLLPLLIREEGRMVKSSSWSRASPPLFLSTRYAPDASASTRRSRVRGGSTASPSS